MILDYKKWSIFEKKLQKNTRLNIKNNFKIIDALYKEAIALKILPMKDPLEGLDIKIKIAKAVNSVPTTSHKTGY